MSRLTIVALAVLSATLSLHGCTQSDQMLRRLQTQTQETIIRLDASEAGNNEKRRLDEGKNRGDEKWDPIMEGIRGMKLPEAEPLLGEEEILKNQRDKKAYTTQGEADKFWQVGEMAKSRGDGKWRRLPSTKGKAGFGKKKKSGPFKKKMSMFKIPSKATKYGALKKNPSMPKRPLSAYMFFSRDQRVKIKSKNPDLTFSEVGQILGAEWKKLSPKQKQKYVAKAERDEDRYAREMAATIKILKKNNQEKAMDD